jgi:hypothetical protein
MDLVKDGGKRNTLSMSLANFSRLVCRHGTPRQAQLDAAILPSQTFQSALFWAGRVHK